MKVIDDATTALKRAKATMAAAKNEESDARKAYGARRSCYNGPESCLWKGI